ncbi:MAG: hypothetical protein JWM80_5021, partial [Cyanobacteria bacterium RYN_339]|nr:hypothetical protein [Cyanobacteria bacterium RYN_339]
MNARTTSIVAVMFLALGGGAGFLKLVSPAMAERDKQQGENKSLLAKAGALNTEIAELERKLNSMAMGSIQYFDLSHEENKKRVMEAKTVETLASIAEILNDNQIRVQALDPKGETEGLNKPVPHTPAPQLSPGASPGAPVAAAATPTPTPTPVPGATTPPPPIRLTHKMFRFEIEGEYPNLVKALKEIQGLPRAISVNAFNVKLVNDEKSLAARAAGGGGKKSPTSDSLSLIGLAFDVSVTFLMDTGGIQMAEPSAMPTAAVPHAAGWLAELGDWFCAPAYAAPGPRTVVRPPNAVKGVTWANGALTLQTVNGSMPTFRVLGARPGFMAIELQRTVTTVPVFFHPVGPGVRQVVAMPSPTDPLATHLAISVDPGTRMRVVMSPTHQLQIFVDGGKALPVAAKPTVPAAKPAQVTVKPVPAAAKAAPAVAGAKPMPVTAAPLAASRPIIAILPPHRVGTAPAPVAAGRAASTPVNAVTRIQAPSSSLKIVVKPNTAPAPAALEPEGDRISAEAIRAWERQQLRQTTAASAPLHMENTPVVIAAPLAARPQDHSLVQAPEMAQTVVALPVPLPVAKPVAKPAAVAAKPPLAA